MRGCIVAVTGASGSAYALRLIEQLLVAGVPVTVMATSAGRDVMEFETGFRLPDEEAADALMRFLEVPLNVDLRVANPSDLFDASASGTNAADSMVVCPASMGFIASLASGLASDLPERAADVMLKERRPLIVVPRETPLSLIHLRNLTTLTEAGAIVLPAMPAFYHRPATLDDIVNFVVGKILDALGVEHRLYRRWAE